MSTAQNSGMSKQQVERDGAAEHFGQVARADGHFAQQPIRPARPARIPIAASLGQVLAGDDAKPSREHLQKDRHHAGQQHDPEQVVLEVCAAGQIGAPVARVHVADAHEQRGPGESPHLLPKTGLMMRHLDRAVQAFQRPMTGLRGGYGERHRRIARRLQFAASGCWLE